MRRLILLTALILAACAAEPPPGIVETTDDRSVDHTGFPVAAVISSRLAQLDDGTTLSAVQYDTTLATPEMIDAAPAALCAGVELALVSSRIIAPTRDYLEIADSRVVEAICKDP